MKIRFATPKDIDSIVAMAIDFHSASHVVDTIPFDSKSFVDTIVTMMADGYGIVIVAEHDSGELVGMIGGMVNSHWFNNSLLIGHDMFWWVAEYARGSSAGLKLLKAFEDWTHSKGCHMIVLAHTPTLQPEKVENLYIRRGYAKQDTYYAKVVNHA